MRDRLCDEEAMQGPSRRRKQVGRPRPVGAGFDNWASMLSLVTGSFGPQFGLQLGLENRPRTKIKRALGPTKMENKKNTKKQIKIKTR